jgi:hypothetical protein
MTSDRQITDDTKEKSNILIKQFQSLFTVESQDNIPNSVSCYSPWNHKTTSLTVSVVIHCGITRQHT